MCQINDNYIVDFANFWSGRILIYCGVIQRSEGLAHNQEVVGSSPTTAIIYENGVTVAYTPPKRQG